MKKKKEEKGKEERKYRLYISLYISLKRDFFENLASLLYSSTRLNLYFYILSILK